MNMKLNEVDVLFLTLFLWWLTIHSLCKVFN